MPKYWEAAEYTQQIGSRSTMMRGFNLIREKANKENIMCLCCFLMDGLVYTF